ncbi:MAG: hypothetical protein R3E01_00015 [Pirellulaceae bacterium]
MASLAQLHNLERLVIIEPLGPLHTDLSRLARLPKLRELCINAADLSECVWESSDGCEHLTLVSFYNVEIGMASLRLIKSPGINVLDLNCTRIDDDTALELVKQPKLEDLTLIETDISEFALTRLSKEMRKRKRFEFRFAVKANEEPIVVTNKGQ